MEQTVKNKVTGEQITFLETAKDTNGEYLLIEVALLSIWQRSTFAYS